MFEKIIFPSKCKNNNPLAKVNYKNMSLTLSLIAASEVAQLPFDRASSLFDSPQVSKIEN